MAAESTSVGNSETGQSKSPAIEIGEQEILPSRGLRSISPAARGGEEQSADIPDGGIVAWLQVLGFFFVVLNTWGIVNTFGTFETYYILVLPEAPSTIAWIGTVEGFCLVVAGVVTGTLHDRGFFRTLMSVGTFLVVFGVMMTSICEEYYQLLLAQGICIGIGCACLFFPSLAVTATYFEKHRASAIGLALAGGQLGGVIYPIVFRQLNVAIGFAWTVRVIGFIALAGLVVANAVHRPRVDATHKKMIDASAFRDKAFLTFSLGMLVMFIGLYQPLYYTPTFGEIALGMPPSEAFYITAILNGCSVLGCIAPSMLGDRLGPLNILIPSTLLTAMLGFAWTSVRSVPALQVLVAFYGFFTGILITLPNAILASLSPSLDRIGTRVGMGYTFAAFGILIGSPLGGLLLDLEDASFLRTQVWGGSFVLGAAVLFAVTRWLAAPSLHRETRTCRV